MRHESEIDTMLADLYGVKLELQIRQGWALDGIHRLAGDKQDYVSTFNKRWRMTHLEAESKLELMLEAGQIPAWDERNARKDLERLQATRDDIEWILDRMDELEAIYRADPWSRFFLVTSSAGHVHSSMSCSTCRMTTTYGWLPELSGLTEADAVAELGPALCSVCFPDAPVEMVGGKVKRAEAERRAKR